MTHSHSATGGTLAMIHTVAGLIPEFEALASTYFPDWQRFNMLDESLLRLTIRDDDLSPQTMRRMTGLVWSAVDAGATAVVVTCSSLGPAVDAAQALCPVPLLRIDQGMAQEAVAAGPRIGVLATLRTTLAPTSDLIARTATQTGDPCDITPALVDGAFGCLGRGDVASHDRLVAEALLALAPQVDVIVLAQASMARALDRVKDRIGPRLVLTSPDSGFRYLQAKLA
ncbi:aspartate/glutamate racemase family protein [Loktanella sp. DJP18]|uniref:aspartate/glutamate racemase family protein n=1 Tax=Loktanella sp. DJP18 TaxID=3409788 RepID=UPI003BB545F7